MMAKDAVVITEGDIIERTKWVTKDHKEHLSYEQAVRWVSEMQKANVADKMLSAGRNLEDIFEIALKKECPEILKDVTRQTKIKISYWQCKEYPVYSLGYFNANGTIRVGGNGYGNDVTIRDLVRYMEDTVEYTGRRLDGN